MEPSELPDLSQLPNQGPIYLIVATRWRHGDLQFKLDFFANEMDARRAKRDDYAGEIWDEMNIIPIAYRPGTTAQGVYAQGLGHVVEKYVVNTA